MFLKFVKKWAPIWKNTWFTVQFITRTMHKPGHYRWVKVRVFPGRDAFGAFVFWSFDNFSFNFFGFEGNCWWFFIGQRTIVESLSNIIAIWTSFLQFSKKWFETGWLGIFSWTHLCMIDRRASVVLFFTCSCFFFFSENKTSKISVTQIS